MSIVAILEVAIGMIFAWLVMSLAGMYIQEWIVGKLDWRPKMLESYIGNLVADPSIARQFYDHQLIKGLHSGFDGKNRPAYIPSAQFSMALIDIIGKAPKEAALIQETLFELENDLQHLNKKQRVKAQEQLDLALSLTRKAVASDGGAEISNAALDEVKRLIRKMSTDFPALQPLIENKFLAYAAQKKQIDNILADMQTQNGGNPDQTAFYQFKAGLAVMSVTHPDLKQAIEALINDIKDFGDKAENALQLAGANIEKWFNNSMDRLSGWYKRRSQNLAFIIGISLAILLNVDSLHMANELWRDPSVREALAAQAGTFVNQNPNGAPTPDAGQLVNLNMQISQLNIPVGWIGTSLPADSNGAVLIGDGTQQLCTLTPQSNAELFGIFVGDQCLPIINTPKLNNIAGWLLKLFGLFITGVAAAQGAPFWFDILKNVVNVRNVGVNSDVQAVKSSK